MPWSVEFLNEAVEAEFSRLPSDIQANLLRIAELLRDYGLHVETGRFGADMQVSLVNDGPVTIILDSEEI